MSGARAAVPHATDDAPLHADCPAAARPRNLQGRVRGGIVGDDHLDHVSPATVAPARTIDRVEQAREIGLLVVGRDDERVARRARDHGFLNRCLARGRISHRVSVYKRHERAHPALIVCVRRERLHKPSLFASGLAVEEQEEQRRVCAGKPSLATSSGRLR